MSSRLIHVWAASALVASAVAVACTGKLDVAPKSSSSGGSSSTAGAGTTAFGLDTGNGIANGRFHDGGAVLDIDAAGFAGMVDKGNLGHVRS